jgi:hypothetical protein
MRVLKQGNRKINSLAYMSFVLPLLDMGCVLGSVQRRADGVLDRVLEGAVLFTDYMEDSDWKILGQRCTIVRLWALFKAVDYGGNWGSNRPHPKIPKF